MPWSEAVTKRAQELVAPKRELQERMAEDGQGYRVVAEAGAAWSLSHPNQAMPKSLRNALDKLAKPGNESWGHWFSRKILGDDLGVGASVLIVSHVPLPRPYSGIADPFPLFQSFLSSNGPLHQAYSGEFEDLPVWQRDPNSVGSPGTVGSFVPLYGSGRTAINAFQNGQYLRGALNSAEAIGDLFLLKWAAGLAKNGLRAGLPRLFGNKAAGVAVESAESLVPKLGNAPAAFPAAGTPSYGALDSLGRPTGIRATITSDVLGTGSHASSSIHPPGFGGGAAGHARGTCWADS
jgi:hypothetical protein